MDNTIPMTSPAGEGSGLRRELGLLDAT